MRVAECAQSIAIAHHVQHSLGSRVERQIGRGRGLFGCGLELQANIEDDFSGLALAAMDAEHERASHLEEQPVGGRLTPDFTCKRIDESARVQPRAMTGTYVQRRRSRIDMSHAASNTMSCAPW